MGFERSSSEGDKGSRVVERDSRVDDGLVNPGGEKAPDGWGGRSKFRVQARGLASTIPV